MVGVDEAGRGCLAGPLVAAAVCIEHGHLTRRERLALSGLNDSKQVAPGDRERLYDSVLRCARHSAVAIASPAVIDSTGLHRSNLRVLRHAMERVSAELAGTPSICLVDGFSLEGAGVEHEAIVKGDSCSAAVAAASIVAKVTRDHLMRRADEQLPGWGFADHVGYGTQAHLEAITVKGPSPIHRMSFRCSAYPDPAQPVALPAS